MKDRDPRLARDDDTANPQILQGHSPLPWSLDEMYDLWWRLPKDQRKDHFWTPDQAAGDLEMSVSRVRGLIDEGKITAIRIWPPKGRIYIHKDSAFAELKQQAAEPLPTEKPRSTGRRCKRKLKKSQKNQKTKRRTLPTG
jgi:hypothetical protein